MGADILAYVAAPYQTVSLQNFDILCREVAFFLRDIGLAAPGIYGEVAHDALAGAVSDTLSALDAGPVLRAVRFKGVVVQDVSYENIRSVLICYQVAVDPPEAETGLICQVPVAEGPVVDKGLIPEPIDLAFKEFPDAFKLLPDYQVIIDTVCGF